MSKKLLDEVTALPERGDNYKKMCEQLEKQVEQLHQKIESMRQGKFRLPTCKPSRMSRSGTAMRLYIPDSHGAIVDKVAWKAMMGDLQIIGPAVSRVIWLGDHMDCGSWLDEKHTIGYVSQTDYTVADDEDAANLQLDQVQAATPNAEHEYLEGNHEWRIEREIVGRCKGNRREVERQLSRNGPSAVMSLDKRGIRYWKRSEKHMGLSVPGVIKLDDFSYATHGKTTAQNASKIMAKKYNANVKYGHTHRADMAVVQSVEGGYHSAWNFGCLCLDNPVWHNGDCTDWSTGYGLEVTNKKNQFLTIHVPIVNGVSLLQLVAAKLAA
jgi:hypothetical protein